MNLFLLGQLEDHGDDFDEDFTSPLDTVDELLYLSDTMREAFGREPQAYQQIQQAMPPEAVAMCQKIFAAADIIRAQLEQQGQQGAMSSQPPQQQ